MGIRQKLLLTLVACFGLMAGISLYLLRNSMDASYTAIERRDLSADTQRAVQAFEAALTSLQSQNHDWSVWNEMYDYALQGSAKFEAENLTPQGLEPADLSLAMVFGPSGQLLKMASRNKKGGPLTLESLSRSEYAGALKSPPVGPNCGLMNTEVGIMLTCWARITRSDGSGDFVGTVVMGRLLDQDLLQRLRDQSGLKLALLAPGDIPAGTTAWENMLNPNTLGSVNFLAQQEPARYRVYYPLRDILQREAVVVSFEVQREVHEQGEHLYQQVRWQLLASALVTALLLLGAVHLLVVKRLRTLKYQLVKLANKSDWRARVSVNGADELGRLATEVNALLSLITAQVETLEAMSMTDALTGLPNRRAFDARLALEFSRERRSGQPNDRPLSLLMIDVDHFKRYNDYYGHPLGDVALREVGRVLQSAVPRLTDLVARYGGEEFVVLLPETDTEGAKALANRIVESLEQRNLPHADSPVASCLTVSIGIATAGDEDPAAFLERADKALYQAKRGGRNTSSFVPLA